MYASRCWNAVSSVQRLRYNRAIRLAEALRKAGESVLAAETERKAEGFGLDRRRKLPQPPRGGAVPDW